MARSPEQLRKIANAEKCLGDFVPFSSEITPGVVKLKGGNGYLTTFEIEGVPFETSSEESVDEYNRALHQFLTSLSGGAFAIWTHKIRMQVHEQLQDDFSNEFSQKLAQQYNERLSKTKLMRTTLFLTVVYRPGEMATFKNLQFGSLDQMVALEREGIDVLSDVSARIASSLRKYKPRRLLRFTKDGREYSEFLSFLHLLTNGFWKDMPVTHRRINDYLCTTRITAGDRSGVLQLTLPDRIRFVSALEIKEYPEHVSPLSLSKTLYLDQQYIETQSFSILANRPALTRLRRQRGQLTAGDESSATEVQEFEHLFDAVNSGQVMIGEYHYCIAVFSDTLDDKGIKRDRSEVAAALEAGGFKSEVQTVLPEASWFFQLPGNWKWRTREAWLTSQNFVSLAPLHNFMAGKKLGNPWGEALCIFDSPSGQPFFFNFHCSPEDHDSTDDKLPANACLFGKTGVGKTTLEMYLMAQLNKYRCRIFMLDMNRSADITVRRMGGTYKTFARGVPTGINPFQWPDSPRTRAFCRQVVTQCITSTGAAELSPDEQNRLSHAIDAVFGARIETRRLGLLSQHLCHCSKPGPAPYKFDLKEQSSYYVKLQTKNGLQTVWGVDLPRALSEMSPNGGSAVGQNILLAFQGVKKVQALVPQKDGQGLPTEDKWELVDRNTWFAQPVMQAYAQSQQELAQMALAPVETIQPVFGESDRTETTATRAVQAMQPMPLPAERLRNELTKLGADPLEAEITLASMQRLFGSPKFQVGKLLEHGQAPLQFTDGQPLSYYLKLQTEQGPVLLWSADFPRAMNSNPVQLGQTIVTAYRGIEAILDDANQLQPRNDWLVAPLERLHDDAQQGVTYHMANAQTMPVGQPLEAGSSQEQKSLYILREAMRQAGIPHEFAQATLKDAEHILSSGQTPIQTANGALDNQRFQVIPTRPTTNAPQPFASVSRKTGPSL